jgi:hypothetical protein
VSRAGYAGLAIAVILAAGFGIRYLRRRRRECSHSVELPAERPPARQGSRR